MSESPSGSSQHPTEEGNAKKRKVFRKQGAFLQTRNDLGTLGTLPLLKSEADAIQRDGIKYLLSNLHELIQKHLHSYLSGTAMLQQYEDVNGYQYVGANTCVLDELADLTSHLDVKTGTYRIRVSQEVSMNVCCKLIGLLKTGSMAADKQPTLVLDVVGGSHKSGGFEDAYTLVNVPLPLMNKAEQERCVFAMRATQFKNITGAHGAILLKEVHQHVTQFVSPFKVLASPLVHVLFHFNDHAFFTYHTDDKSWMSVLVNLSYGSSTFHIAGREEEAIYDGIGSGHIFPSKVYHRSGRATRRSVKVAFFFQKSPDHAIDTEDSLRSVPAAVPSVATADPEGDTVVKEEKPDHSAEPEAAASPEASSTPPPSLPAVDEPAAEADQLIKVDAKEEAVKEEAVKEDDKLDETQEDTHEAEEASAANCSTAAEAAERST
tara:strand:- start:234 stop:1535 length:1302 start_codon:yes stop_codon:yes gene_type:complete